MRPTFLMIQAVLCTVGAGATPPTPAGGRPQSARTPLASSVKAALHTRMAGHEDDMAGLVHAVVLLQYEAAARTAHRIAAEPKLARAFGDDLSSVNAEIPLRFFELQDNLGQRASALEAAALARDDAALAEAYGRLAAACVACHSAYLTREGPDATAR